MKEKLPENIQVRPSTVADVASIAQLIDLVPEALLPVELSEIQSWVEDGRSLVAVHLETGEVLAHQGLGHWELEGGRQATELRSAYTHPDCRGMGINTILKKKMIERSQEIYPGVPVVGFTEAPSKSRGILVALGFKLVELTCVPSEFFSICPKDCAMKNGHPCGCKVFVNEPEKLIGDTNSQTIYQSEYE